MGNICLGCNQPIRTSDHDSCHIVFDTPKTYKDYCLENRYHIQSILDKYSAPRSAQPPIRKEPKIDNLLRSLMKPKELV